MLTIQSFAADANAKVIEGLKRTLVATPADKLEWSVLDTGRSALNQGAECVLISNFVAVLLNTQSCPEFSDEAYAAGLAEFDTLEKVLTGLDNASAVVSKAILEFPADKLESTIVLPWFPEPQTFAEIMFIAYWNNTYHMGQVNFIQTLFGDKAMH